MLAASAVAVAGPSKHLELDLTTRSCRFQFEPGRFDEAELAQGFNWPLARPPRRCSRAFEFP